MSEINVRVSADTSNLSSGLDAAKHAVDDFKEKSTESLKDIAADFGKAFAVGAIVEGVKGLFEEMSHIHELSERFNVSAESIQRVGVAAKAAGVDLDGIAKAMGKVDQTAVAALKGDAKLADAFSDLGIDAKEFVDMPMEEKMLTLSEAFEKAGNTPIMRGALREVLGKQAGELIPILAQGTDKLRDMMDTASVVSDATVEKMHAITERIEQLFNTVKVYGTEAIGFVLDKIQWLEEGFMILGTYVANLPKGFKAATEAANEFQQAIRDVEADKAQEETDKAAERAKKAGTADAIEQAKAEGEAATELEQLREEHAKKAEEARLRALSLASREYELRQQIAGLEVATQIATLTNNEKDKLAAENKLFDLQKEFDANQKEQSKQDEKNKEEEQRLNDKAASEERKAEAATKKEQLKAAEDKLSALEKTKGISVDSLRSVGGGMAGVNYNALTHKDDLQRQGIDLQKQTVEQLKQAVRVLEEQAQVSNGAASLTGDGSFAL